MIILNLVEDILDIIKDDERHTVKICVDTLGVTVYIDDDPEDMGEENMLSRLDMTRYIVAVIFHRMNIKGV